MSEEQASYGKMSTNPGDHLGKKVKLIKGMSEPGRENEMVWIAGIVPVGSVGTLVRTQPMVEIKWDDPELAPRKDYIYGINKLDPDFFQLLQED